MLGLLDPRHRRLKPHAVAKLLGHTPRHEVWPADEARLLRAARGVEQAIEATRSAHVRARVEERQLLRLGAPERLARDGQQPAHLLRVRVSLDPRGEGLAVALGRAIRAPRLLPLHAPREPIEPEHRLTRVEQRERPEARDRAGVAHVSPFRLEQVLPSGVGREDLDADRLGQREHPVLPGTDESRPKLDHGPVADRMV